LPAVGDADQIVITGDVTESGLAYELEVAESVLDAASRQGRLLVVPGNHDVSVHGLNAGSVWNRLTGARRHLTERFVALSTRGAGATAIGSRGSPWPIRRDIAGGRCVLYGLDSTRSVGGSLFARGCLGDSQIAALDDDLAGLSPDQRVVIALHHHVTRHPQGRGALEVDPALELDDKRALQRILRRYQVELVLHGHRHRFWHRRFRDSQVIGASSTTLGRARFILLVSLDLDTGAVSARRRFIDRDREGPEAEDIELRSASVS
jgi:3',5'-cyclic AMP phosphodiesterase CpdA